MIKCKTLKTTDGGKNMRWNNLISATLLSSLTLSLTPYSNHYRLSSEQQAIAEMSNLYVIGDSLSDAGGIVGAGTQFLKVIEFFPIFNQLKWKNPTITINFVMALTQLVLLHNIFINR